MEHQLITSVIKDGSVLMVLGFFVWYFMKQLAIRDQKIDELQAAFIKQEVQMIATIAANTAAFDRLTACLKEIEEIIVKTTEWKS